jgi:hypothetical protein
MDEETLQTSLRASKRTLMIMWFVLLTEPLLYALLPWIISAGQLGECTSGVESTWRWGAYLLAVALALASLALDRFLLSDRQIKARLAIEQGGVGDGSLSEAQLASLARHYQTARLMGWGLNGCVPIGGLILLFTNGDCRTILVLAALSVVLNLLSYPQLDAFIERVRNLMVEEWM